MGSNPGVLLIENQKHEIQGPKQYSNLYARMMENATRLETEMVQKF